MFDALFSDITLKLTEGLNGSSCKAEIFSRDSVESPTSCFKFHYVTFNTVEKVFRTLNIKKTEDF